MNSIKKQDLMNGSVNEIKFYNYMKNQNKKIKKHKNQMNIFDFYIKRKKPKRNIEIELKSRNNKYKKYSTTMVGYNKINYLKENNKKGNFYFLFTDGLYKWKYKEGVYRVCIGGRCDRGRSEYKEYAYIDIKYLKLITTEINSISY